MDERCVKGCQEKRDVMRGRKGMIDVYDKQTRPARVQIRMELKDKKANCPNCGGQTIELFDPQTTGEGP